MLEKPSTKREKVFTLFGGFLQADAITVHLHSAINPPGTMLL
jgi:hypothetical protein